MSIGVRALTGSLAGLLLALTLATGCSRPPPPRPKGGGPGSGEDPLTNARDLLLNPGDQAACRGAVLSLNQHLNQLPRENRPEVTPEVRKLLAARYGLSTDEIGEVTAGNLTTLDVTYLESCMLFREAAAALALEGQPPAERAVTAWRWCMRQVRPREREGMPIPAHLVLRRGYGSALERSLVFAALVQQLGLPSCLVTLPGPAQEQPRYWVCGVLVPGAKGPDILLFDPRLGLPLPGPKGQGTLTLAELRTDPSLLKQLDVEKDVYDVTAEQVRSAEIRVAAPLSSLAPRLKLTEELLGPGLRVHLAFDAAVLLKDFDKAASVLPEGSQPPVRISAVALQSLRGFLSSAEGGVAKTRAPVMPVILDIPLAVWPKELALGGEPQHIMEGHFLRPFRDFALESRMPRDEYLRGRFIYLGKPSSPDAARMPFDVSLDASTVSSTGQPTAGKRDESRGSIAEVLATKTSGAQGQTEALDRARMPRDQILRGRLDDAAKLLTRMETQLRDHRQRLLKAPDVAKELAEWREKMITAQANLLRAERGELPLERAQMERTKAWIEGERPRSIVLEGIAAQPLLEEVTYQLALCNHEKAERLQDRLARSKSPSSTLTDEVRDAWREAANVWETFLEEHADRPIASSARRLRARVHEALGDKETAAWVLQLPSPDQSTLERLARAYEARRLKMPGG